MARTIAAVYESPRDALAAAETVVDETDCDAEQIGLVSNNVDDRFERLTGELMGDVKQVHDPADAGEGAAAGAISGGVLGGILLGLSTLSIPVLGPIAVAGQLGAIIVGAGAGAGVGGVLGALAGWGIPKDEAQEYAEAVRRGATLVAVRCEDGVSASVETALREHHPLDLAQRAKAWREEEGWDGFAAASESVTALEPDEVDPVGPRLRAPDGLQT